MSKRASHALPLTNPEYSTYPHSSPTTMLNQKFLPFQRQKAKTPHILHHSYYNTANSRTTSSSEIGGDWAWGLTQQHAVPPKEASKNLLGGDLQQFPLQASETKEFLEKSALFPRTSQRQDVERLERFNKTNWPYQFCNNRPPRVKSATHEDFIMHDLGQVENEQRAGKNYYGEKRKEQSGQEKNWALMFSKPAMFKGDVMNLEYVKSSLSRNDYLPFSAEERKEAKREAIVQNVAKTSYKLTDGTVNDYSTSSQSNSENIFLTNARPPSAVPHKAATWLFNSDSPGSTGRTEAQTSFQASDKLPDSRKADREWLTKRGRDSVHFDSVKLGSLVEIPQSEAQSALTAPKEPNAHSFAEAALIKERNKIKASIPLGKDAAINDSANFQSSYRENFTLDKFQDKKKPTIYSYNRHRLPEESAKTPFSHMDVGRNEYITQAMVDYVNLSEEHSKSKPYQAPKPYDMRKNLWHTNGRLPSLSTAASEYQSRYIPKRTDTSPSSGSKTLPVAFDIPNLKPRHPMESTKLYIQWPYEKSYNQRSVAHQEYVAHDVNKNIELQHKETSAAAGLRFQKTHVPMGDNDIIDPNEINSPYSGHLGIRKGQKCSDKRNPYAAVGLPLTEWFPVGGVEE